MLGVGAIFGGTYIRVGGEGTRKNKEREEDGEDQLKERGRKGKDNILHLHGAHFSYL